MRLCRELLHAFFLTGAVLGAEILTFEKVEADITADNLWGVLQKLNETAASHGGNRASGTHGYKAAADYVVDRLKASKGKDLDVQVQPFTFTFEQTIDISLTGPDGEVVLVTSLGYNHATPKEGITAELVDTPVDDKKGSACLPEQWASVNATGKIALIKRGNCPIADKVKLAGARGALAVILYNQHPGPNVPSASLGADNVGKLVPVGVVSLETGLEWKSRLSAGGDLASVSVTLVVDAISEERETWNIIAETKEGNPDSVVMLGAHLDTVHHSPGINDDGSGVAALLELADSFKKYEGFNNTDRIRFYFNYDMIGSKLAKYRVYADTHADRAGASLLFKYLTDHGKHATYERFGLGSDYVAFLQLGIPSSGIFTGGAEGFDTCYHQKCDNIDNINLDALVLSTKAAGHVAAQLALSVEGIPAREKQEAIYDEMTPKRSFREH
ncbi:Aminopeptidase Y [Escovopsis weberi]|uniref:Peptide hydrolase n=1 Tax=Escovopsis weberi TaxID=150374 RepID=A0A0M8MZ10_ESCWE|nr:Aminopeptidase Y [Escovopsis weberi]